MRAAIFIGLIMIASSIRTISGKSFNDEQLTFIAILIVIFFIVDIIELVIKGNKSK